MKNSTDENNIIEILKKLQDTQEISGISGRIDAIRDEYLSRKHETATHADFNKEISSFVSQISTNGLRPPKFITGNAALAEAIWLLDFGYKSEGTGGYYAALIDATNPAADKFGLIIHNIAETIKAIEIRRHTNWLFLSTIDPTDTDLHYKIVKNLLEKYELIPPSHIPNNNPFQFIKHYRDLIENSISAENLLKKITTPQKSNP